MIGLYPQSLEYEIENRRERVCISYEDCGNSVICIATTV